MALTPAPTSPHYPFIIGEISGGGGDGKTHFCCSLIGRGLMAYFHSAERPGTIERFAAWGAANNCRMDWDSFGLMIDSRWDNDRIKSEATSVIDGLYAEIDDMLLPGKPPESYYATAVLDSLTFLKSLAFLAEWGNDPPMEISKRTGEKYLDRRKVYSPVNRRMEELYAKFRNQPLREGKNGKPVGTSLLMTSEGRCIHDDQGNATDIYEPYALGRLDFATDFRAVVGGPTRGSRANTIVYHKGGTINKLGKPLKRVEAPEALCFLLGVDLAEWGRGPDVPPSFAPATCENTKCGKEGLEYAKVDGEWMMVEADGKVHDCG